MHQPPTTWTRFAGQAALWLLAVALTVWALCLAAVQLAHGDASVGTLVLVAVALTAAELVLLASRRFLDWCDGRG